MPVRIAWTLATSAGVARVDPGIAAPDRIEAAIEGLEGFRLTDGVHHGKQDPRRAKYLVELVDLHSAQSLAGRDADIHRAGDPS